MKYEIGSTIVHLLANKALMKSMLFSQKLSLLLNHVKNTEWILIKIKTQILWHTQNSLWEAPTGTSEINIPSKTAETVKKTMLQSFNATKKF